MPRQDEKAALGNRTHMRGFASLSKERRRELAILGGKAAHEKGTAHKFTPESGRVAGKMRGKHSHGVYLGLKDEN